MFVFQDSEMRYPFDIQSRVRCSRRGCKRGFVLRQVWRLILPGKVMPCFSFFEDN